MTIMSTSDSSVPVLLPFHQSWQSRHAYHDRTRSLLSVLDKPHGEVSLLSFPEGEDERRPTSTYIVRALSDKERVTLLDPQQCNCRVESDNVQLQIMYRVAGNGEGPTMSKWDMSSSLQAQVRNNCFGGRVILGVLLEGPDAVKETVPSGLRRLVGVCNNGLVQNSILEPGCSVHNNAEVSSSHAMKYAAIIGCGTVSCSESDIANSREECNFDMASGSMDIEVGPEAGGGRVVNIKAESTLVDVCHDLNMDSGGEPRAPFVAFEKSDVAAPAMNILCPHSSIVHTPQTRHVHLFPHATIDAATSVAAALLLPRATIRKGCTVSHALLQWNATLTTHSDAQRVCLMERAEVGPHSFTANAIYGPDAHVSGGEVHCTVFGPNANSHHQSLLIGILWPLGRGNVGYGSNVGSNHTGRIPDQETSVGEGTFWGLGSVIKFPVDLTSAPYSIIAAGVQLPPQRITLPFSLITDGPGGMNQLTPGWLLQYSPYTVARSEVKFANRRKAKRHDFYTGWKILRAGTIDMLVDARDRLVHAGGQQQQSAGEGAQPKKPRVFKTDKAIPGLGANQLTEKGRQIGIRAYTDAIQRYALRGLLVRLVNITQDQKGISKGEVLRHVGLRGITRDGLEAGVVAPVKHIVNWPVLPWNEASHADTEALWKHQHAMLLKELPSLLPNSDANDGNILSLLLQKCSALEEEHATRVYKSKSRDDARGASTVPGYKDAHTPAEKDSVVIAAAEEAGKVKTEVQLLEAAFGANGVHSRL